MNLLKQPTQADDGIPTVSIYIPLSVNRWFGTQDSGWIFLVDASHEVDSFSSLRMYTSGRGPGPGVRFAASPRPITVLYEPEGTFF